MRFKTLFVLILIVMLFVFQPALSAKTETPKQTTEPKGNEKQMPESRGKGLATAIQHVPTFVAEKLRYMSGLFAGGTRGIGQQLSEWIHTFFKPAGKNETQT